MNKLERQFAKRLDDLEREFLTRYRQYLNRVIYLPHAYDARQASTVQLPLQGQLSKMLTDHAHEVYAVGQAHGSILCREAHRKYSPMKLADWQPGYRMAAGIEYTPETFWLKPDTAIKSLESREILLAGDVEADILAGVKQTLLQHLHGATRPETEEALADLLEHNVNRAKLITTTETTYAYNRGRLSSFYSDGVDYVQFSAVIDARTSPQCRSREGKVMRIDSPELAANTPPLHGRCRSVLSPIYSKYQPELITEESTDWSKVEPLPKGWVMDTAKPGKMPIAKGSTNVTIKARVPLKEDVYSPIESAEKKIIGNKTESAILFDKQGNKVFKKAGTDSAVSFTREEVLKMPGNILTHNHPRSSSFSAEDIIMLRLSRLKEIRAATKNGVFIAKAPNIWMPFTIEEYKKAYKESQYFYMNYYKDKIKAGELSPAEAWIEHSDRINKDLAKQFSFTYEFKKW